MSNRAGNLALGVPKLQNGRGPGAWTCHAACRGQDPNLWFRDEHDSTSYREARAVCANCPVTADCLAWALETRTEHGVFGGLSPRERKNILIRDRLARRAG